MSSLPRKLRRAEARRTGRDFTPAFTPVTARTEGHDKGGYDALHPTKGWRRFSAKRRRAQGLMARMHLGLIQRNALKAAAFDVHPRIA